MPDSEVRLIKHGSFIFGPLDGLGFSINEVCITIFSCFPILLPLGTVSPLPSVQTPCLVLLGVRKIEGEEEQRREQRKEGVDLRREIESMSSP
jgi:hypothetical protein